MTGRISRREWLAASPLALTECGRTDDPYFGNTRPPKTQRLTMVLEGEPESIDPPVADGMLDPLILSLVEALTSHVRSLGNNLLAREPLKYLWIDTNWRPQ